jgi:hypothetical protein
MKLDISDNDYNNDYDNKETSAGDDKDNLEVASAPQDKEDAKSCKNCLLRGIVCTNNDYGLGVFIQLPEKSPEAPVMFGTVEL